MREYGSEFSCCLTDRDSNNLFPKTAADIKYIRCGREAIGYLIDEISDVENTVLMPAYSCASISDPFKVRHWNVIYYPLSQNLIPNEAAIQRLVEMYHPQVLFIINYFGFSNLSLLIGKVKTSFPEITIVEDATHILFSLEQHYSPEVDYYVASIRKWFGIPDGAVAISTQRRFYSDPEFFTTEFVRLRMEALGIKEDYFYSKQDKQKQRYRKLFLEAENSLENGREVCAMSEVSRQLFSKINVEQMIRARRANYEHLTNLLQCSKEIKLLSQFSGKSRGCSFSVPILVDQRDEFQRRLAQNGVFAPILWPINEQAKKVCSFSKLLSEKLLSMPIDQRYGYDDMENIAQKVFECLQGKRLKCEKL